MKLRIAKFLLLVYIFSLAHIQPSVRFSGFFLSPSDIIFILLFVVFSFLIVRGELRLKTDYFYLFIGLYFFTMIASLVFSDFSSKSLIKLLGEAYLISIPVVLMNLIESEEELRLVILCWIAGALIPLIIALISIVAFYLGLSESIFSFSYYHYGGLPIGNYPRIRSTFITPSLLLNYLSVTIVLLLIAKELSWINQRVYLLLFVVILIVSFFTFSSGLGGIILILGIWFYMTHKNRVRLIALILSLISAMILYLLNFVALSRDAVASHDPIFADSSLYPSARLLVWQASIQTIMENPIFGKGLGADACQVLFQNTDGTVSLLTDAHNVFLNVAAQSGLFGLIALILIILTTIRRAFFSEFSSVSQKLLASAFGVAFISAFLYQGLLSSFEDARHIWSLIGLIMSAGKLRNFSESRYESHN
ncbi:MAG: O-antigen ligase domain-containing protein [Acidobacteria bacterium]|nr:MAG: O-antigen ligase domain-containing protein [Acidobacteriota bacterium]